jgi:circadian clock protein KaiB
MAFAARKPPKPEGRRARPLEITRSDEAASDWEGDPSLYRLRLYVAGNLPNSAQALENLLDICRTHLDGRHSLEVVDYLEYPRRALEDGIIATPTLLKVAPGPTCMVVGTLSDRGTVLQALGLLE